jgi:hypothetical protein
LHRKRIELSPLPENLDAFARALVPQLRIFREPISRDTQRLEEIFAEEFARMHVDMIFHWISDHQ